MKKKTKKEQELEDALKDYDSREGMGAACFAIFGFFTIILITLIIILKFLI